MKKLLIFMFLIAAFCLQAQTYVNIPFKQSQIFTVSTDSVIKTIEQGQGVDLGAEIEINGGSGKYSFVWTHGGAEVGTSLLLNVNSTGEYMLNIKDGAGCEANVVFVVKLNTGFDEISVQQVNVYPVPASECVFVRPLINSTLKSISVYNASGELIRSVHCGYVSTDSVQFGLEGIPAGQYLLTCDFVDRKITRVIVIK